MKKTTFTVFGFIFLASACKEKQVSPASFHDLVTEACVCMGDTDLEANPNGFQQCLDSVALAGKSLLLQHCFEQTTGPEEMALHTAKQVLLDSLNGGCVLFKEMGYEVPMLPGYWLSGKTLDVSLGTGLDSVTVYVQNNAGESFRLQSDKSGFYKILLPLRGEVTLTYSKPGFVSKKILLRLEPLPKEHRNVLFESVVDMRLFQMVEGFNTSITDEPIGIMYFDEAQASFAYDFAHTERIQNAIAAEYERLGLTLYAPAGGVPGEKE